MKKNLIAVIFIFVFVLSIKSQDVYDVHHFDLGAGIGFDYGGIIGIKLTALPIPYVGILTITGVSYVGFAWHVGVVGKIYFSTSQYRLRPNVKLMYGTNGMTCITVSDASVDWNKYNMLFKGITPGIGLEFMLGKKKRNGFDIDVNIPVHGKDYKEQVDEIESNPKVDEFVTSWPVTVSLGYDHEF